MPFSLKRKSSSRMMNAAGVESDYDLVFCNDGDIAILFFGTRPLPLEPIALLQGQKLTLPFTDGSELTFALWPEEPAKLRLRREIGFNSVPPGTEGEEQYVVARLVVPSEASA